MIPCCILVFLSLLCTGSNSVHVKNMHAIHRDKIMCIETSKLTSDTNHTVTIDNVNVTLSIHYYQNSSMDILLEQTEMCLTKAEINTTKKSDVNFFCGKYEDPLLGTNTNLDMYKHMKIKEIKGNIDVSMTNETGFSLKVILDHFEVRANIEVSVHLHGYDPCRFKTKSTELCGKRCKPICELYATGHGMFECSDKLKAYNKDIADMIEVAHSPFQLSANKIHLDNKEHLVCVQATTDIRSTCYAEFTSQSLQLYSPRTKDLKTFETSPTCKTMFFTSDYPGTFCFRTERINTKNWKTYVPKTLKLYNLTMYCDDFSFFDSYREINLFRIDIQKYKMMMIYDICPHRVIEKGFINKDALLQISNGYLIEHVENKSNQSMIALIIVCTFIFIILVSLLLFFVFQVRKTCV